MYASIFFARTWESLAFLFVAWVVILLVWLILKPSLARDMESVSPQDAEIYRAVYERANPRIGRTWIAGGILAMAAYAVMLINWPHENWSGTTLVPLLRVLAEFSIGAAFGQGVDLVLGGAPVVERWIKREEREKSLGRAAAPLLWFLRNPSLVFAIILISLVSIIGYQGDATEMVLNIAGALIVTKYLGPVSLLPGQL
jgi:hypothetical protein